MKIVSIITPCLNGMPYLVKMLTSVKDQTYQDWKLIFVDDGSTDGSLEFMLKSAAEDSRIVVKRTNGFCGVSVARNLALSIADGEYVAFLDCDDWWHHDKLKRQIEEMTVKNAVFSCCSYFVCASNGMPKRIQSVSRSPTRKRLLYKYLTVGCLTVMFDRIRFKNLRFDVNLKKGEDYVFWCQLLDFAEKDNMKSVSIDFPLAYYRLHESNSSSNKFLQIISIWGIHRKFFKFSIFYSIWLLSFYLFFTIFNRLNFFNVKSHEENI